MKILAFDTATQSCSVALTDDRCLLAEISLVKTETHSRHLASLIQGVCRLAGLKLPEVDGYAVTRGPGSFTGLRIGVSTAIGLAEASGKPVAGLSTLNVLAAQAMASSHLICSMIDARRGEVYFAAYKQAAQALIPQLPEQAIKPENAIDLIGEPCLFVGSGATLYRTEISDRLGEVAQFAPELDNTIRAATVASLAYNRFMSGEKDDIMNFTPVYLRKSDAELGKSARPQKES